MGFVTNAFVLKKAFTRGISIVLREKPDEIDPHKILGRAKLEAKGRTC